MKKDLTITATVAASLMSLSLCSAPKNEWEDVVADDDTAVCVDQQGRRIDDDECRSTRLSGGGASRWYYMRRHSRVPLYGDSVHDARFDAAGSYAPQPGTQYSLAPIETRVTRAQAISRGGLGGSARRYGGGWS